MEMKTWKSSTKLSLVKSNGFAEKVSASLRQIAYETDTGDTQTLVKIDDIVNTVWGEITNLDLSGCKACEEDRKE